MKNLFLLFLPRKILKVFLEVGIFSTSLEAIDVKKLFNRLAIKKSSALDCLFMFKGNAQFVQKTTFGP